MLLNKIQNYSCPTQTKPNPNSSLHPKPMASSPLLFTVRKRDPILVPPAGPTPSDLKLLSDIDDQPALRFHISGIHIYSAAAAMASRDPAALIREALSKALVFYYPLAGRLRELPGRKLAVDCTAEGALFVEADAEVRLDQFGYSPQPPFPCLDKLIHGIGADFLTSPLVFIQVTRLSCGGFILAHHINHTLIDAAGIVQFLKALAELAGGATSLSLPPVWAREQLMAREPPRITHEHPEYDEVAEEVAAEQTPPPPPVVKSFFFGPREFAAMRQKLPKHDQAKTTRFELLTACLWLCRVVALGGAAGDEVRARFILNGRNKCSPSLPEGFYGNAIAYPVARTTAGGLTRRGLAYAVELVRKAKNSITEGYMQSVADLMVLRGRPMYTEAWTYLISDLSRLGFEEVDFGWGRAVYSGPAVGGGRGVSHYIKYRNSKGEDGILVPVNLPAPAMQRFDVEIEQMLTTVEEEICNTTSAVTKM